jgi:dihydrofolate reductase
MLPKLCVRNFSISLDGYGGRAKPGPRESTGCARARAARWMFATRSFDSIHGGPAGGQTGVDDDLIARGDAGIGATTMGRNMFGPIRGAWGDTDWSGWWGYEPPYRHPVCVLTHHPRPPIDMKGDTTFHFVSDGIEAALQRANRSRGWQGREAGRRCKHDPAISTGWARR